MMNGTAVMGVKKALSPPAEDALRPQQCGGNSNSSSSSLREASLEAQRKVQAFLAEEAETPILRAVQDQVRTSLAVIDQALEQYGIPQLSLSYNGGKDCLVLLYLLLASLPRHFSEPEPCNAATNATTNTTQTSAAPNSASTNSANDTTSETKPFPASFQAVYVVSRHPFAEVDSFVDESSTQYHLDVERVCMSMKQALHAYLESRPQVKAVFVGTRRTDPHGQDLTHFDETDPGWPSFMRVHPVIDWHYVEIWAFIRHLGIPYCELYDRGYTSLGGTTDTSPNPALKRVVAAPKNGGDRKEQVTFRPAYELIEDMEERLGRE